MLLRLNLFGSASIELDGAPVSGRAAQGRRLALLALLARARARPLSRDKVIGLLWPDLPADRARRQLSDDLYIVRNGLGDGVVRSTGDELALDARAVTSDVATFDCLLDQGQPEAAVALFVGPLLDGFHLSDAGEFEHWLDAERDRLGQRYASALQTLAESSEERAEFAVAADWWHRLAAHDPYSGRVSLRLMRALEAAGDRAAALRHARVHTALLRAEFDAGPDRDVAAYMERLRAQPLPETPAEPVAVPVATAEAATDAEASPASDEDDPDAGPDEPGPRKWRGSRYATAAAVLGLALIGAFAMFGWRGAPVPDAAVSAAAPSVGVLPFVNMSADPDNTYFSDGLSEQIIAVLSRIDGLSVPARTSSFALRDGGLDVRAIGEILGVAAVLEGSVRRDGSRLRVTAQLIDAVTGYHIWSEDYDRELEDIFAVQAEIARAIADALAPRLTAGVVLPAASPPVDLEAYDFYLRGLYLRNDLTRAALLQAVDFFDSAIARAPEFALAYAAKASVIAPLVLFGHIPAAEGTAELRAVTARALELDPTLGEAQAALGLLRLFFDWDWEGAEQALRSAIELNPNDAHAYHHLGNYLRAVARLDEAVAARARAVELDPLNARTIMLLGNDYRAVGDHERALTYYRRALQLDPVHPLLLGAGPWLPSGPAWVYLEQGRTAEAVEELAMIAALRGASTREVAELRDAFANSGMPGFWRSWLEMDLQRSGSDRNPLRIAGMWALSGDTAQALEWLERAYAEHNHGLIFLRHNDAFNGLRSHPRFARIVRDMKFPGSAGY